jgi:hypothetical protein
MPYHSENLQRLLDFGGSDLDRELDIAMLSEEVSEVFGSQRETVKALLANATGKIKLGTLGVHMLRVIKEDSAVRDIVTTGHLAKLLSRLPEFRKTSDYRLLGLPNPLFDRLSQIERTKYFEHGVSLELDADLFESMEAQQILTRESEILARF